MNFLFLVLLAVGVIIPGCSFGGTAGTACAEKLKRFVEATDELLAQRERDRENTYV